MEKWVISAKKADFKAIADAYGIDQVTARLIRNRDVVGMEEMRLYLNGSLKDLYSAWLLKDCDKLTTILLDKIAQGKKIRIIGDYDIDGVCSTYILYKGLLKCGADVDYEIPDRMKDGYGLNEHLICLAHEEKVDTILTCDNGIAAVEQTKLASEFGMTMLITDHHEPQEQLPEADALVNPKQTDCTYPFKGLCGAAVAFKVMSALYGKKGFPEEENNEFLEFVAIATIGDVMDLKGENRILVKEGLKNLNRTSNQGLKALISETGLECGTICAYHIGFVLGPCINASGRLDTAKRALQLFLTDSTKEAQAMAAELKSLNDERKQMTLEGVDEAIDMIEHSSLQNDRVLVVYLPKCHESLAGIIAGRIRERYQKPVFVLTDGTEGVKGSGRSIEAYNMFEEMMKCRNVFTKFGGHPMAAGLSLEKKNVDVFRKVINEQCSLTQEQLIPKIVIDVPMPIHYITEQLIKELNLLEPFGKGNTKPLFAEKNLSILNARILGKNKNVLKLQVQNAEGTVMDAMYFGDIEEFRRFMTEKFGETDTEKCFQGRQNQVQISAIYYPSVNEFRNQKSIQIVISHYC